MSDSKNKRQRSKPKVSLLSGDTYMARKLTEPKFKEAWDKLMMLSDEEFLQREYEALMASEENEGEFPDRN